jgi:hypothetical protein
MIQHYSADVRYKAHPDETKEEQTARWKTERIVMREQNYQERYFKFDTKDEMAQKKAQVECVNYASIWEEKLGFPLEVCQGMSM